MLRVLKMLKVWRLIIILTTQLWSLERSSRMWAMEISVWFNRSTIARWSMMRSEALMKQCTMTAKRIAHHFSARVARSNMRIIRNSLRSIWDFNLNFIQLKMSTLKLKEDTKRPSPANHPNMFTSITITKTWNSSAMTSNSRSMTSRKEWRTKDLTYLAQCELHFSLNNHTKCTIIWQRSL